MNRPTLIDFALGLPESCAGWLAECGQVIRGPFIFTQMRNIIFHKEKELVAHTTEVTTYFWFLSKRRRTFPILVIVGSFNQLKTFFGFPDQVGDCCRAWHYSHGDRETVRSGPFLFGAVQLYRTES